jgi:F-type H+-transporting ATPase subunit delta
MTNKLENIKIIDPYAEAFFQLGLNLSITQNNPDIFYQLIFDIQDFLELVSKNPELDTFLKSPLNSDLLKKSILNKIFENKISSYTLKFFNLLIDKKRISFIDGIGKRFLEKAYDFICITFVEIKSTIPLVKKQQEILISKINKILGPIFKKPYVQYSNLQLMLIIDEEILGGLTIKIGSKIIDLSLRNELQKLRKDLNIFL